MCLAPLGFIRSGKNKGKIVKDYNYDDPTILHIPCGKCLECQENYSRQFAVRVCQELKYHKENCFVTLTYAISPVSLVKKDLQDFFKRLRKKYSFRYFACGEYGSKGLRPHYHVIFFGYKPHDLILFKKDKRGFDIYRSLELEKIWKHGFVSVGLKIDSSTAKYCAKYMQKCNDILPGCLKPFILSSRRPGIGFRIQDISQSTLDNDRMYLDGKSFPIPRFYLKKIPPFMLDKLMFNRFMQPIQGVDFLKKKQLKFLHKFDKKEIK